MTTNPLLLKNGRIIDPANNIDQQGDILIINNQIAQKANQAHFLALIMEE